MNKGNFIIRATIAILLVAVIYSCSSDKLPETCSTAADVSFSMDVLPILNANCVSCHSGPSPEAGIDQSSWATVKATVDNGSFLGSIKHESPYVPMPLNGELDPCNIQIIETWVNEGAENN